MVRAAPLPGLVPVLAGPGREALSEHLRRKRELEGPKPTRDDTRLRGSQARQCSRKIYFDAQGIAETVDIEDSTLAAFEVGNAWHEVIQLALVEKFDAETEVAVSYKDHGLSLSGSADATYLFGFARVCVEIKSMKAYGWDLACRGNASFGQPSGPKLEHITQAGLYANAPQIQADVIHMIYVNKDNGELAEWLLKWTDDLGPLGHPGITVRQLVDEEMARMASILEDADRGIVPAREIPGLGLVADPPPAGSRGTPWNCRFCGHQPLCVDLAAEAFPLSTLSEAMR